MVAGKLPREVQGWIASLTGFLHVRSGKRLRPFLLGHWFARGRRTVTSWLRGGGLTKDYQDYYYFLGSLGRKIETLAGALLHPLLAVVGVGERLVFALDDTPTKRYGPKVQGAGIHHNPTPGPTDQKFVYGHIWVTVALLLRHAWWMTIALPVLAKLYVRQKDIRQIPCRYGWQFHTKLELAAQLVTWAMSWLDFVGKPVWFVVDGFYAKKPFLSAAQKAGAIVVGRLRKDAGLHSVPKPPRGGPRRPGRPRKYGAKMSLAKRAGQQRGWQNVTVLQYGQERTKKVKTFLATWKPAGAAIRVVLVEEEHGWLAFFCTDPEASVTTIVEIAADRMAIEQTFHDVKEVEGAGQQQVRNLWSNIGAFNLNLWAHTLVEMWAWRKPKSLICDRSEAPYDDAHRRPSHADRRKALQRSCLEIEFSLHNHGRTLPRKTKQLLRRLAKLAA